jgi:RNA polymerase sigma-70 factor (ECF subfamily)
MAAAAVQLARDEAQFERLYREYAGDVYRYALAIMRNPSDAEDVTQTTFMNAWRAYSEGEEPRAPLNWFISIAHNVCRLRFRTNSRRPREVEFEPALAEAPAIESPDAGEVLDALAELPLNQRAALVMRELEGRSYAEIATVLGVSRSAVETLIFRARRSLRIRRDAIRTLAVLPLPQSLTSFFRSHGAVETGAALLGSGAAAKAVAVLAAGLVAAGAAHEAVLADSKPASPPAKVVVLQPSAPPSKPTARRAASAPASKPAVMPSTRAREANASARRRHALPTRPASLPTPRHEPAAPPAAAAAPQAESSPPAASAGPSAPAGSPEVRAPEPRAPEPAPREPVAVAVPLVPATPALPEPEPPELPPAPVEVPPVATPSLPAVPAPAPELPSAPEPPALPTLP